MADAPVSIANSKSLPCTDPDTGTTVHDVPVTLLPDCRSERENPLPDQLPDSVSFGPVAQANNALTPTARVSAQTAHRRRSIRWFIPQPSLLETPQKLWLATGQDQVVGEMCVRRSHSTLA